MDLKNVQTLLHKYAQASRTTASTAQKLQGDKTRLVVDVTSYAVSAAALWGSPAPAVLYSRVAQVFGALTGAGFALVGVLEGGISPALAAKYINSGLVPPTAAHSTASLVVEQALRDAGAECLVSTQSAEALIVAFARENAATLFGVLSNNPALLLHSVGHIIFADSLRIQQKGSVTVERYDTEQSLRALRKSFGKAEAPSSLQRAQFAALLTRSFLDTNTLSTEARYSALDLALVLLSIDREVTLVDFDTFKVISLTPAMGDLFADLTNAYKSAFDAKLSVGNLTLSAASAPWIQPQLLARLVSTAVPTELRQLAVSGLAVAESDDLAPHFFRACSEAMFTAPAGRPLAWVNLSAKGVHLLTPEANATAENWCNPAALAGVSLKGQLDFAWGDVKRFEPKAHVSETLKFFQGKIPENIANKTDMAVYATVLTHVLFQAPETFNAATLGRIAVTGNEAATVPAVHPTFTTDVHEEMGDIAVDLNSVLANNDWEEMDDGKLLTAARNSQGYKVLQDILNPPFSFTPSLHMDEVQEAMKALAIIAQPAYDEVLKKHFSVDRATLKMKKADAEKTLNSVIASLTKGKEDLSVSLVDALTRKTGDAALDLLHLCDLLKEKGAWVRDAARAFWKTLAPAERKAALEKMMSSSNKPIDKFRPPKMYPNQEKVLEKVSEQLQKLERDSSTPPLHLIYSTPTGSGKTFTTLLLYKLVMRRFPNNILIYSVPTKQVLKRVGTDVEANQVPYWTAGFANEGSYAVRRPHSIRNLWRANPLKKAGMLAMLAYSRKLALDAKDKNGGKPSVILSDIKATGELLRVAALLDRLYNDPSDDAVAKLVADEIRQNIRPENVEVKQEKNQQDKEKEAVGGDDADEKEKKERKKRESDPVFAMKELADNIENKETRLEVLKKLGLESFTLTNLVLFYDEPNMGIHLNSEVAQTTKKIVQHLPKTAILASATMPDWDRLPSWWRGERTDIRHEIVSEAPYGLPMNKLHQLDIQDSEAVEQQQQQQQADVVAPGDGEEDEDAVDGSETASVVPSVTDVADSEYGADASSGGVSGTYRAVSVFDVFPTHADFAKFTSESDESQFAKLLRHFTPQQTNSLLSNLDESTSTFDNLCSSVKEMRKTTVASAVKNVTASDFANLRNTWSDFKGTPVKHVRDVISKEGITLVASANPSRVAREMTGISPANWRKAENAMRRVIQVAKAKQTQMDKEYERAISGKGKRRDGDDGDGREPERQVYEAKVGQVKLTLEDLERASLEALVLLSKGVAGSFKGVDPFIEEKFQQAVLAIPESKLDKVATRPPIYILVVDYGSVYGMDCPGVDTVLVFEDLASHLSQDDLVQLLGRLRRDGRVIFRSFGTLSTAITADRECERWKMRLQEEVRDFVHTAHTEKLDVKARIASVKRFARRLYEGASPSMGHVLGEIVAALILYPFREARNEADHIRLIQSMLKDWKPTLEQLAGLEALDQVYALRAMERALRVSPAVERSANFLNFVYTTCDFDAESVLLWQEDILRDVTSSDRFWKAAEAFVKVVEEESEEEEEEDD